MGALGLVTEFECDRGKQAKPLDFGNYTGADQEQLNSCPNQ